MIGCAGSQFTLAPVEVLADGSWIANLNKPGKRSIRVRVIEYSVTSTDTVTGEATVAETVTLITSLLDPDRCPIEDFPDPYRQRWTSETVFDEVKTDLRGGTEVVFRSTSPDGVLAEFWGLMCLYQGISDVVDHVVLDAGPPPGDAVGFEAATSLVRRSVSWTDAAVSPLRTRHGGGYAPPSNSPASRSAPDPAEPRPASDAGPTTASKPETTPRPPPAASPTPAP